MKEHIRRWVNIARKNNWMIVEIRSKPHEFCFPDGGKEFIARCLVAKIRAMRHARDLKDGVLFFEDEF